MKPCFEFWLEIAERLRGRQIFLALDFDGVLSPIAAQPALAKMSLANRSLLQQLVRSPRARIAIVSGRALIDVRQHVGVAGLIYAGNHGSEIDLHGVSQNHVGLTDYREKLIRVREELKVRFASFHGLLLEDKGFGVGLHYRELDPAQLDAFHLAFSEWSKNLPEGLQIVNAKRMFEIRPTIAWNKGNAVRYLWQIVAPDAVPICLGDDLTDEDGFLALKDSGINIYVGEERQSYAEYILASTGDVTLFLERLVRLLA